MGKDKSSGVSLDLNSQRCDAGRQTEHAYMGTHKMEPAVSEVAAMQAVVSASRKIMS